jgi:acetyl-CoA synthetase
LTTADVPFAKTRDVWMDQLASNMRPYCPCEPMDSEDTLFILYTSGSTGQPKGLAHTTAGYMLHTVSVGASTCSMLLHQVSFMMGALSCV